MIIQILITGVYGAALLINLISNENSTDNIEKQEAGAAYIKNAALQVLELVGKSSDKKANKKIENVYDLIHSSPIKTVPEAKPIEDEILSKICELKNAVNSDNISNTIALTSEIFNLVSARNQRIRMSKSFVEH